MLRHPLFLFLIFLTPSLHSQYYFYNDKYYNSAILVEAGLSAGGFNCLTDLGGNKGQGKRFIKDINWQNTHPGVGIFLSLVFDQVAAIRLEANFGRVSASDHILKNDPAPAVLRYQRNLHFRSNITELLVTAEFFPRSLFTDDPLFSPYLAAGVGIFRFNPQAKLKGKWYDLQPLHTEGQGFKQYPSHRTYHLTQLNFPVGIGARYELSAVSSIRLEILYRLLKTDYLDDVSTRYIDPIHFRSNLNYTNAFAAAALADRTGELQPGMAMREGEVRGNPENRDAYFTCNVKFALILNRKRR